MRFVFKPLLFAVTAFNVFLFISLFGHRGEGRPMMAAYMPQESSAYRLSELGLLDKVVRRIDSDYVDPERVNPSKMLDKAFERIQREITELMFEPSADGTKLTVTVGPHQTTFETEPVTNLSGMVRVLKQSMAYVEQHLKTSRPLQDVEYAAINGILSTLDPHSVLLPPEMAREMDVQIQGEFGGLGITISLRGDDNILTVISTLPDTPAARANLKPGDQILQIEDESTINMGLSEAVSKLRGLVGTSVTILVGRREWEQPRTMTLQRETIKIDSTVSAWLGQGVGYVHVKAFQHNTSSDLLTALENFRAEHGSLKGLVLDLRNNPGGPLEQAIEVSDMFLENGVIVETVRAHGKSSEERRASLRGTEDKYPVVVLVDAESASASEIVAGALKNQDRAIVVGDQTFGKGSVQNLYPYPNDAKLKMTIAKYLTPGHRSIQSIGISPDVQLTPVYLDKEHTLLYAASSAFREKDLDSHFEESKELLKSEKPLEVVRYFSPRDFDTPAAQEAREKEEQDKKDKDVIVEPKKPDPREDWQVQFCRDLILKGGRATRTGTLGASKAFLKEVKESKESEIQKQLSLLGVDWSQGKGAGLAGASALKAEVKLGDGSGALKAGETATFSVTVTNKGKNPAYRVRTISACELGTFQDVEMLFGKIEPGASRTVTREIKMPQNLFSLGEQVTLKVFESGETPAGETTALITVQERPQPTFAYSLVVVDDGSGTSSGNGDGLVQRGENIDLVILMKNVGDGSASRAFAKISNKEGRNVYLKRGTANLKEVASGGWVEGRFHFQVRDSLKEDKINFELMAGDAAFMRRPADEVSVPVAAGPAVTLTPASGLVRVAGAGPLAILGGASDKATAFANAAPGTVLTQTGKLAGWVRVSVPWAEGSLNGWVPESSVTAATGAASDASSFTAQFSRVPPLLSVPIAQYTLPNEGRELALSGNVLDDGALTSMYVFVNNKKRYLRAINPADMVANNGQQKLAFDFKVPLEEGTNTVELYVEDDSGLKSFDLFQVYRARSAAAQVITSGRGGEAASIGR